MSVDERFEKLASLVKRAVSIGTVKYAAIVDFVMVSLDEDYTSSDWRAMYTELGPVTQRLKAAGVIEYRRGSGAGWSLTQAVPS